MTGVMCMIAGWIAAVFINRYNPQSTAWNSSTTLSAVNSSYCIALLVTNVYTQRQSHNNPYGK